MQAPTALLSGRYRFKAKVDAGTKAPTWLATDDQSKREVVASALGAARVAALMGVVGLRHQHLAAIVDVIDHPESDAVPGGASAGASVVVAEFTSGKTLHAQLKQARLTPPEAVTLWIRLCRGVGALHANGGAHGAISPRSIVIEPAHGKPPPVLTQLLAPTSGAYCAPERLQGRGPSSADDTWALHATLFAALTGSPPFKGDTKDQLLQSIASGQLGRLGDHGIRDEGLEEILAAGLAANLARRRTTIEQMLEALEGWAPKSERAANVSEWEEDAATIVAHNSEELAAKMAMDSSPSPRPAHIAAGPSLPPVPVDDHHEPQIPAHAAPPDPVPQPNPYDDEEDQTTVMEKPPEMAQLPGPGGAPPRPARPRAPPPPGFAAADGQAGMFAPPKTEPLNPIPTHDGSTPGYPAQAFAPAEVAHAPHYEAPPEIPSAAFSPMPHQPVQQQPMAAFPPPTSAYPPSIPAPAPTGLQVSLDDVEFRKPSRRPLIVIAVLLLLIAIGMAVLLVLNYRGVITLHEAPADAAADRARV